MPIAADLFAVGCMLFLLDAKSKVGSTWTVTRDAAVRRVHQLKSRGTIGTGTLIDHDMHCMVLACRTVVATRNRQWTPLDVQVAQLPKPLLKLRDVLESRGVFDESNLPDCCCINIYSPGMWLPPHVDNLDFSRPFCTVSLLSDQPVIFGDGT